MIEFDSIVVQTQCRVSLQKGEVTSFSIDEDSDRAGWIEIDIVNGELVIYTRPEFYGFLLLHDYYPKINITFNELKGLRLLDRCFVKSIDTLLLHQTGIIVKEGSLNICVDAFSIDCTVLKNARVKISGESIISHILTNQKAIYDGSAFECSEGTVHAHFDSTISIWYTTEVEIGLWGRSKLTYRDTPRMKIVQIDEGCSLKALEIPLT
ncbi:hypothetical protein KO02_08355 [Sphingobacterium sp. ML3W]|uniref:GIN domain-containing protein n=1 Tax=Sphingobacterium sp. ML3W TaxID=1538644 RepID=UPI0004F7D226|nr:DUF2807 domain-containing protein [Sphingobacterium sp. ML3W]AIM36713.1 hypothetical protein KO02_08355 [Sphingobacterium sp. ML3W]